MAVWNQLQRGDGPTFDFAYKNEGGAITAGMGVAHRVNNAASFNGNILIEADSGVTPTGFAGIALADVAAGSHGLARAFGAVDSVLLSHVGSSLTITVGDPLVPGAATGSLFSGAPTWANSGFKYVVARATVSGAISAANYVSGFVRAI